MPVIGSPNAHARNHRVPRSFRATPRKIAHLMILCRTGNPLLFRMTRNSRLMLSILVGLSPSVALKLTLYRGQGAGFASIHFIYAVCGNRSLGLFIMPLFTNVLEGEFSELPLRHVLGSSLLASNVQAMPKITHLGDVANPSPCDHARRVGTARKEVSHARGLLPLLRPARRRRRPRTRVGRGWK